VTGHRTSVRQPSRVTIVAVTVEPGAQSPLTKPLSDFEHARSRGKPVSGVLRVGSTHVRLPTPDELDSLCPADLERLVQRADPTRQVWTRKLELRQVALTLLGVVVALTALTLVNRRERVQLGVLLVVVILVVGLMCAALVRDARLAPALHLLSAGQVRMSVSWSAIPPPAAARPRSHRRDAARGGAADHLNPSTVGP